MWSTLPLPIFLCEQPCEQAQRNASLPRASLPADCTSLSLRPAQARVADRSTGDLPCCWLPCCRMRPSRAVELLWGGVWLCLLLLLFVPWAGAPGIAVDRMKWGAACAPSTAGEGEEQPARRLRQTQE